MAIVGNAGGGKSTLARRLSAARGLPLYALDLIQWQPGWKPTPAAQFAQAHREIIELERWVLDGFGDLESVRARFDRADTIVFVDLPLWRHYWWAMKRQVLCLFRPRPDGPPGCPMLPVTGRLLRMMWDIHRNVRPRLIAEIKRRRPDCRVIEIKSTRDMRDFVRRTCPEPAGAR